MFVPNPSKKISKKMQKKIKKIKNLFQALFIAKMGGDRPKKREEKFQSRIPFILGPGKKIPKKKQPKNSKN